MMTRMSLELFIYWKSEKLAACPVKEANPYVLGHVHPKAHFVAFLRSLGQHIVNGFLLEVQIFDPNPVPLSCCLFLLIYCLFCHSIYLYLIWSLNTSWTKIRPLKIDGLIHPCQGSNGVNSRHPVKHSGLVNRSCIPWGPVWQESNSPESQKPLDVVFCWCFLCALPKRLRLSRLSYIHGTFDHNHCDWWIVTLLNNTINCTSKWTRTDSHFAKSSEESDFAGRIGCLVRWLW